MFRFSAWAVVGVAVLSAAAPRAAAEKRKMEISKKWSGSVAAEAAPKPECITSAKGLEAVWKAWQMPGEVPTVDFTRNLIVAAYSVGSKLELAGATLNDDGNVDVLGIGTRDIRPGFRFVLGVIPREGVRTVSEKELPKE